MEIGVLTLLRLGSIAENKQGNTLQPVRLHAVTRGLSDGFNICLNPECKGKHHHASYKNTGPVTVGLSGVCPFCGKYTFPVFNCISCGSTYILAEEDDSFFYPPYENNYNNCNALLIETKYTKEKLNYLTENKNPGKIGFEFTKEGPDLIGKTSTDSNLLIWKHGVWEKNENTNNDDQINFHCFCCGEDQPFFGPSSLTNRILRYPILSGIFGSIPKNQENDALPGHGRQILVFSDSRQEAARLAPIFADTHNRYLFAAACTELLASSLQNDALVNRYQKQRKMLLSELESTKNEDERIAIQDEINTTTENLAKSFGGVIAGQLPERISSLPWIEQFRMSESIGTDLLDKNELFRRLSFRLLKECTGTSPVSLERLGIAKLSYPYLNEFNCPNLTQLGFEKKESQLLIQAHFDIFRQRFSVRSGVGSLLVNRSEKKEIREWGPINAAEAWDKPEKSDVWKKLGEAIDVKIQLWPHQQYRSKNLKLIKYFLEENKSNLDINKVAFAVWQDIREFSRFYPDLIRTVAYGQNLSAYQLIIDKCILNIARKIYKCDTCSKLSTKNFFGLCLRPKCSGKLILYKENINKDELKKITSSASGQGYRIWKLLEDPIGYRSMEHTAQRNVEQLEMEEIRFRLGERNLMSSSTTLELGVDIGDLLSVLMNNTPPSSKNYRQRAGRAGRSGRGMALSLTLAGGSPQDHWFFRDPDRYFKKENNPPWVLLESEQLVQKHVNSWLFSNFFREGEIRPPKRIATGAYGSLKNFILPLPKELFNSNTIKKLKELIPNWPFGSDINLAKVFSEYLKVISQKENLDPLKEITKGTILEDTSLSKLLESLSHAFDFQNPESKVCLVKAEIEGLIDDIKLTDNKRITWLLQRQLNSLENTPMVEWLAKNQLIPRYGFPIDVIKLHDVVSGSTSNAGQMKKNNGNQPEVATMERNVGMAIWEYAPGNEIVFNGKVYTVKGLSKPTFIASASNPGKRLNRFQQVYYLRCKKCFRVETKNNPFDKRRSKCKYCQEPFDKTEKTSSYIEPNGFYVDKNEEGRRVTQHSKFRPVNTYALPESFPIASKWSKTGEISFMYDTEFQLLNLNQGKSFRGSALGYNICKKCGAAEPAKKWDEQAKLSISHCDNYDLLTNVSLGVSFSSEALYIRFPDIEYFLTQEGQKTGAQIFRLAASKLLSIDVRSLEAYITKDDQKVVLIMFETREGGTGILGLLRNRLDEWFNIASSIANEDCLNPFCSWESSCPECLLTYDKQRDASLIKRDIGRELFGKRYSQLFLDIKQNYEQYGDDFKFVYGGIYDLERDLNQAKYVTFFITSAGWTLYHQRLEKIIEHRLKNHLSVRIVAEKNLYIENENLFKIFSMLGSESYIIERAFDFIDKWKVYIQFNENIEAILNEGTELPIILGENAEFKVPKVNNLESIDLFKPEPGSLTIDSNSKITSSQIFDHFLNKNKVIRALYSDCYLTNEKAINQVRILVNAIPWNKSVDMSIVTKSNVRNAVYSPEKRQKMLTFGPGVHAYVSYYLMHARILYLQMVDGTMKYLVFDKGIANIKIDKNNKELFWFPSYISPLSKPLSDYGHIGKWLNNELLSK